VSATAQGFGVLHAAVVVGAVSPHEHTHAGPLGPPAQRRTMPFGPSVVFTSSAIAMAPTKADWRAGGARRKECECDFPVEQRQTAACTIGLKQETHSNAVLLTPQLKIERVKARGVCLCTEHEQQPSCQIAPHQSGILSPVLLSALCQDPAGLPALWGGEKGNSEETCFCQDAGQPLPLLKAIGNTQAESLCDRVHYILPSFAMLSPSPCCC